MKGCTRRLTKALPLPVGKYPPGKEPIRLQDSLPCPLKKNHNNNTFFSKLMISKMLNKPAHSKETEAAKFK